MNPLSLEGKVAIITGGASGLGFGAAKVLGQSGASVALLDNSERVVSAQIELESMGIRAIGITTDVTSASSVENAVEQVAATFGRIDIVFANAGINGVWAPVEEITAEEFEHTFAVNVTGCFLIVKFASPYLRRQGGSVIFTSSVNGTRCFSNTGASTYSASKAAQISLMKMYAVELGRAGIRVNAICPGSFPSNIQENTEYRNTASVRIPMHFPDGVAPLKRQGTPEDVGNLVLFLSSDLSAHITGEEIFIDAGASLVLG